MKSYNTWISVSPIWTTSLSLNVLQKHDRHVRTLLTLLQTCGIVLNPSKCVFCVPEIFLGYNISFLGSWPLPEQVADLQACPLPKTIVKFRSFLEILNFYWRFLPHAAAIQAPLHDVLSGTKGTGSHRVTWTARLITASDDCQASLARAVILAYQHATAPLALVTDASTTSMGAVL
jgi:hypothetical protein